MVTLKSLARYTWLEKERNYEKCKKLKADNIPEEITIYIKPRKTIQI
jgi:hypothetical protein